MMWGKKQIWPYSQMFLDLSLEGKASCTNESPLHRHVQFMPVRCSLGQNTHGPCYLASTIRLVRMDVVFYWITTSSPLS